MTDKLYKTAKHRFWSTDLCKLLKLSFIIIFVAESVLCIYLSFENIFVLFMSVSLKDRDYVCSTMGIENTISGIR